MEATEVQGGREEAVSDKKIPFIEEAWEIARTVAAVDKQLLSSGAVTAFAELAGMAVTQQNERIRELEAQLEQTQWRCFHCDFVTSDRKEAMGHFGDMDDEYPVCVVWSDLNADEKVAEYASMGAELAAERDENTTLQHRIEGLEHQIAGIESEISSRFKGCRTINDAWHAFDSMEGRALAAEEIKERQAAAIQAAREALEAHTCRCHILRDPSKMSAAALESGAPYELITCRRCAALAKLREVQGA